MIKPTTLLPPLLQLGLKPSSVAQTAPPALKGGWSMARDVFEPFCSKLQPIPNVAPKLSPAQVHTLERLESAPALQYGRKALDVLRESPAFKRLDANTQTRVLQIFLDQEAELSVNGLERRSENFAALAALLDSPGFAALGSPLGQQSLLLTAFERAGAEGKKALVTLAARHVDGQPALASRDSTGTTLAVRLASLSMQSPARLQPWQAGVDTRTFYDAVLRGLANPESLRGAHGEARAADVQRQLATQRPAELARIFDELVGQGHSSVGREQARLELGVPLGTGPGFSFAKIWVKGTPLSDRIFQSVAGHLTFDAFRR